MSVFIVARFCGIILITPMSGLSYCSITCRVSGKKLIGWAWISENRILTHFEQSPRVKRTKSNFIPVVSIENASPSGYLCGVPYESVRAILSVAWWNAPSERRTYHRVFKWMYSNFYANINSELDFNFSHLKTLKLIANLSHHRLDNPPVQLLTTIVWFLSLSDELLRWLPLSP